MPRAKGWWEEYKCGCLSDVVARKADLLGYCPVHGYDARRVWPWLGSTSERRGGDRRGENRAMTGDG